MAVMIPPYVSRDIKSNAEKKIFTLLDHEKAFEQYICLHSLGIARHKTKRYGEIDFVILSSWGILCLEVKGGKVKREKGVWVFADRYGRENTKRESPFEQVQLGMFSLREDLIKIFGNKIKGCRFGYGVLFPDIKFSNVSPEWDNDIVYTIKDNSKPFSSYINRLEVYWDKKVRRLKRNIEPDELDSIKNYLRGDFEDIVPLWKEIEDVESSVIELTKEQYKALDRMSANKKVFFNGPAGTGKTLLAVEQVRRMLLTGKKVLMVCFNVYLGKMLQLEVNKYDAAAFLWSGTLHGYFFDIIKRSGLWPELENKRSSVTDNQFYGGLCPEYFKKALEIIDVPKFDCLVVDEAQDLLCENYFDPLKNVISGGFVEGQWYIFYDSNNQEKLYNNYDPDLVAKLKNTGAAEYSLDLNCRNTENVAIHTSVVSGFKMAETKIKSGHKIEYLWYDNLAHQAQMLSEYLKKILAGGVKPNEITILYPGGGEEVKKSILSVKTECTLEELTSERIEKPDENIVNVSSVQAYKGLENKVIILVGIDKMEGAWINTLNYVGMSRARDLLCISLNKDIRSNYNKKIMELLTPKDKKLKD